MSADPSEGHHDKPKKHKEEKVAAAERPRKAESKQQDKHADKTARQMKLMQKWGGLVQSLRDASTLSPEEGVKVFDEAIEKLSEVKRDKEKVYLVESGLPEMMSVVLDSKYLVDSFHKKINELLQKALTFALESLEVTIIAACAVIKDIFGHPYFEEIFSSGVIVDAAAPHTSSRDLLTTSKRIRTLHRLNDALDIFCNQKGYQSIHALLARPHQPLEETVALVEVVVLMTNYLNTSTADLVQFVREANARLTEFVGSLLPHEVSLYSRLKDFVHQLVSKLEPSEIGLIEELWKLAVVAKIAHAYPTPLPVLLVQHPEKSTRIISFDPTKMQLVKDAKQDLCRQANMELDELTLKMVSNGLIVKTHEDNHNVNTMNIQTSFNVAYQIPVGWRRKYVQVLIVEGKSRAAFIPFYVYVRRKDLTGKHIHDSIIPSYFTFTVKSMTEKPFTLKAVTGSDHIDIHHNSNRLFPNADKGDTVTIRVDWAESAEANPILTNELLLSKQATTKIELLDALVALLPVVPELRTCFSKATTRAGLGVADAPAETLGAAKDTGSHHKSHHKIEAASSADDDKKHHKDKENKEHKKEHKHKKQNSGPISELEAAQATVATFQRFFDGLSTLLSSCDLDLCKAAVQLFHAFCLDIGMRDLLATFSPVPRLSKNLFSPSVEVRQWSSLVLTFFGHDSFFYQRPTDVYETFDVRSAPPNHLNQKDAENLQFLYQVNSLRTVDPNFIDHATSDQLFWFLPLMFQTLQQSRIVHEGAYAVSTLRSTLHLLLEKLQPMSYLRQFTLWLKFSGLIDEREFDLEWAIGARFESTRIFFQQLAALMPLSLEIGKKYTGLDIVDPMHDADGHNLPISAVTVLKVFSSKAKPCLLELFPADSKYPPKRVIFKKGDDLRQDLLVQACFYLFNMLWSMSDLADKPFIHQYRLIPMGPDTGCVEFVQDSESLQTFSFEATWPKYTEEDKSLLLRSAAGSYVAGWVMGVRDRHQDNMMIQHGNLFFHIDLGHIFNEKPTIDAPRFSIPTDLKESMSPAEWERFKDLCANGFKVLHRQAGLLVNLICIMFKGVVEDLPKTRLFLTSPQSLMLGLDEKEATDKIRLLIDSGVTSMKKKGKYLIHNLFVGATAKSPSAFPASPSARQTDALLQGGTPDAFGDESESNPEVEIRDSTDSKTKTPQKTPKSSNQASPRGSAKDE